MEEKGHNMTRRQRKVKAMIKYLTHYMTTYDKQLGYLDYTNETIVDDVLYGLGVALDRKYKFAGGFDKFKKRLRRHLAIKSQKVYYQRLRRYLSVIKSQMQETRKLCDVIRQESKPNSL